MTHSDKNKLEAERAVPMPAHEAIELLRDALEYYNRLAPNTITAREALRLTANVVAAPPALDTEGLPPLPEPDVIAYTCIGDNDAYSPMLVKQIVAPYAERIRQLERGLKQVKLQELSDIGQDIERELATFKGEHATQLATIDTPEFRRLSYAYAEALFKGTAAETAAAWISLIAHINAWGGAGSAAVPEGWKLVPVEPTKDMFDAARLQWALTPGNAIAESYTAMLRAAPSPAPQGKEEANGN